MGIGKYWEDNIEIFLERIERKQDCITNKKKNLHYYCPYCSKIEVDQNLIFLHIKTNHNIVHPVVSLNGKIINDNNIICKKIDSIVVFTYGYNDPVYINDELQCEDADGVLDLTDTAKKIFKENGKLYLSVGKRKWIINRYSIQQVRKEFILPVIEEWENKLKNKKMIDFDIGDNFNEVELEYLKGFYSYYVACISDGPEKRDRYFEAYNSIASFSHIDHRGIYLLKVVAFYFNWINSLNSLCILSANDDFNNICMFYRDSTVNIDCSIHAQEKNFFITDDIKEYIDAVNNYLNGNYDEVKLYLLKYSLTDSFEPNFKDRLLFLKARLALMENNTKKYNQYLRDILCVELKK